MNFDRYPWLQDLSSPSGQAAISKARRNYLERGAATFPEFISPEALSKCIHEATSREDDAFTTDDKHTPHQLPIDTASFSPSSVRNFKMRTRVASIAYDELPPDSALASLYQHPTLRRLVAAVTGKPHLYLLDDPIGACTVNVFRKDYHHSFHFDESEFSTTLMLQKPDVPSSGLFQYTNALREDDDDSDLALNQIAALIKTHHLGDDAIRPPETPYAFCEEDVEAPELHTLEFEPGTLSVFSGSRSLHRVTRVEGAKSRLVAVLTFASSPGFRNSKEVQTMFWGRCE